MMKRLFSILLTVMLLASVVACGAPAADTTAPVAEGTAPAEEAAPAAESAADDGTLKLMWHQRSGIDTLFEAPFVDKQCLYPYMVFDPLVSISGKDATVVPKLASEYAVSDDGTVYTFTLRDNVKWQNGDDFTAADVAYTFWLVAAAADSGVCGSMMRNIVGADEIANGATSLSGVTVDGNKVSVELVAANRSFISYLAMMDILPANAFAGVAADDVAKSAYWEKPYGTGIYTIDQVAFPDYFTLVPNENYWGEKAKIQNVLFTNYTTGGDDAVIAALVAGELDFAYGNTLSDINVATSVNAQNADVTYAILTSNYVRYFVFNEVGAQDGQEHPGMKDVKVRQAISMLVDREAIASLYAGQAEVRTTFVPDGNSMYNEDIPPFSRDVDGAIALLNEANFDFTKGIRICYYYDDQTTVDAMDLVCQNLADAGIKAEAFLATGDLGSVLYTVHNYDILYCGWTKDDPIMIYTEIQADGGEEPIQDGYEYRKANFSDKINAYNATTDEAAAKQYADEIQVAGIESAYFAPVYGLNAIEMTNTAHVSIPEVVQEYGYQYNRDYKFAEWSLVG